MGLTGDFDQAGVCDIEGEGPAGSEVLVRPAREGSFLIEVIRVAQEVAATEEGTVAAVSTALGLPSIGMIVKWATKSEHAAVVGAAVLVELKTADKTRKAIIDDKAFLLRVSGGLALRKDDIVNLKVRADTKTKNGNSRTTWTVVEVKAHRRAPGDNDA